MKKSKLKNIKFQWNVWIWDVNHDRLESYDVIPTFVDELKAIKPKDFPKTKEEFSKELKHIAMYHFWAKCEYEMIIHSWPRFKNEEKVDVYNQLELNWDIFVDKLWEALG